MSTNGRGSYHEAILCWKWTADGLMARSLAHRVPTGWAPSWVCVVPEGEGRPEWIPSEAFLFALADGDTAWVW